jgi:uncharacterized SAM-binding protein YcdF (DUF218 family)
MGTEVAPVLTGHSSRWKVVVKIEFPKALNQQAGARRDSIWGVSKATRAPLLDRISLRRMETLYSFAKSLIDPLVPVVALLAAGTLTALFRKQFRVALFLLPALAILYGTSIDPVASGLCLHLEKDYLPGSLPEMGRLDVVVVLGGGVSETGEAGETLLSQPSSSRLLRAVQAFHESGADNLLCMGIGIGRQTEAEVMARAAEGLGVPRDRIVEDRHSRNTTEHAVEMDRRFTDKTIRIGLVTSACHMERSEREFRAYFANVVPIPSDFLSSYPERPAIVTFVPNTGSLSRSTVALREMAGNFWYQVKPR